MWSRGLMDPILFICQIQFDWLPLYVAGDPVIDIRTWSTAIISIPITFCNTEAEMMTFRCSWECQNVNVKKCRFLHIVFSFCTWGCDTGKTTSFPLWVRVSYLVFLCHRVFWLCLSLNWLRFSLLSFACHVTCCIATLHQCHCYCCCCHWRTDYRKSELWQPKKRGRRTSQWMSSKGRSIQTTVRLTAASTQVTVGIATGV